MKFQPFLVDNGKKMGDSIDTTERREQNKGQGAFRGEQPHKEKT